MPQKQIYLDYLEEPEGSERRSRGDEHGIYASYRIEKAGFKVLIVLLDIRYESTPEGIISDA